ncbi:phosphatidate cytidylyltransferase [Kroppenstedtia sanguinis]|uniref:phosphatidate cytidylyltransferase n=1 Tax=Kroppenstedtia sanguinis TaxID=1380684 RepID=UPI003D1A8C05
MKQRIITGVLGGAGFLAFLWGGGWSYAGLIGVLATIGYVEFCRMKKIVFYSLEAMTGLVLMWMILLTGLVEQGFLPSIWPLQVPNNILMGLVVLLTLIVTSRNRIHVEEVAYLFLGSLYIGFGFSYMIQTRLMTDGVMWSLLALIVTWTNDSGAYFTGKRWGKRKLWPSISPNKTVEGSLGGMVLSLGISGIIGLLFPELGSLVAVLGIGLMISIVGPLGDLIESAIKRTTGVKDTGSLLPGHGGVLDRFDSLLLVFIVLHTTQLI